MTDIDAACGIRELIQYNRENKLSTPQNGSHDSIWDCVLEHALRALLAKSGYPDGSDWFIRNPNGSYRFDPPADARPTREYRNVLFEKSYPSISDRFAFRVRIRTDADDDTIRRVLSDGTFGEVPDGLPAAIGRACRKQGWDFDLLGRNLAGFPADVVVRCG